MTTKDVAAHNKAQIEKWHRERAKLTEQERRRYDALYNVTGLWIANETN